VDEAREAAAGTLRTRPLRSRLDAGVRSMVARLDFEVGGVQLAPLAALVMNFERSRTKILGLPNVGISRMMVFVHPLQGKAQCWVTKQSRRNKSRGSLPITMLLICFLAFLFRSPGVGLGQLQCYRRQVHKGLPLGKLGVSLPLEL
jgi:hypothetical protein